MEEKVVGKQMGGIQEDRKKVEEKTEVKTPNGAGAFPEKRKSYKNNGSKKQAVTIMCCFWNNEWRTSKEVVATIGAVLIPTSSTNVEYVRNSVCESS